MPTPAAAELAALSVREPNVALYSSTLHGIPGTQACLDLGPSIVYNVPARTAQDIPPEVIGELAGHANFLGVKECTGNDRIQVGEDGITTQLKRCFCHRDVLLEMFST